MALKPEELLKDNLTKASIQSKVLFSNEQHTDDLATLKALARKKGGVSDFIISAPNIYCGDL